MVKNVENVRKNIYNDIIFWQKTIRHYVHIIYPRILTGEICPRPRPCPCPCPCPWPWTWTWADGHGQGHARGRGHGQIQMFFNIFSIQHFLPPVGLCFFLFDVLSRSAFFPFSVFSIRHFLLFDLLSHTTFFPFDVLSHSEFFPFDVVSHSAFCHSTFCRSTFCTFGVCYFDILSVNRILWPNHFFRWSTVKFSLMCKNRYILNKFCTDQKNLWFSSFFQILILRAQISWNFSNILSHCWNKTSWIWKTSKNLLNLHC